MNNLVWDKRPLNQIMHFCPSQIYWLSFKCHSDIKSLLIFLTVFPLLKWREQDFCHFFCNLKKLCFPPLSYVFWGRMHTNVKDRINWNLWHDKIRLPNYALFQGHPLVYQSPYFWTLIYIEIAKIFSGKFESWEYFIGIVVHWKLYKLCNYSSKHWNDFYTSITIIKILHLLVVPSWISDELSNMSRW